MLCTRLKPRRYQLNKEAAAAVRSGHPWIYRGHISSAAAGFPEGQWLALVGSANEVLGFGIFQKEGPVGIRVLSSGSRAPGPAWVEQRLDRAMARRRALLKYTDAFRAVHGENDGLPGVVVDVYGKVAVLQTYHPAVDSLGRYVACRVASRLGLQGVIWKLPAKRRRSEPGQASRVLRGTIPPLVEFREGKATFAAQIGAGQKSGTFLDLRGLRKWVAACNLKGRRVLNLFCYSGTLGLMAESAGAREIWNVDVASGALDLARRHHCKKPKVHRWIEADIFDWLKGIPDSERFDLVIVDPPAMASAVAHVPRALAAYRRLYREAVRHVAPGGWLAACCCTSRIPRAVFRKTVESCLPEGYRLDRELGPEDDHPVGFPEGDYLKLLVYRSGASSYSRGRPRHV